MPFFRNLCTAQILSDLELSKQLGRPEPRLDDLSKLKRLLRKTTRLLL